MPIRGSRSIYPKAGRKPTGIFGQPQKNDPTSSFAEKGLQSYAHSHKRKRGAMGNRLQKDTSGQSLRHQKP